MFNVTFQRTYKDGDVWRNAASFGQKTLLVLSFIAARAFEWIASQSRKSAPLPVPRKAEDNVPY